MSDGGKGSSPRPFSVDKKTFDEHYEKIFNKNKSCNKNCTSTECAVAQMGEDSCCKKEVKKSIKD